MVARNRPKYSTTSKQFNTDNGTELTAITETFISPMNIRSDNIESVGELQENDAVIIPESPTNRGGALKVLDAGLDPIEDVIYVIDIDLEDESLEPYFNLIVSRPDNVDSSCVYVELDC